MSSSGEASAGVNGWRERMGGPGPERGAQLVAGAVVGVLATLLVLAGLASSVDNHYVTRREYEATLVSIREDLGELRAYQQRSATAQER